MLHDAPWIAGPAPRRYDPDEAYYECVCGVKVTREGSYGCQGSDTCTARMCEGCKAQCDPCGLPACREHMTDIEGQKWCGVCLASDEELKEAV